MRIRLVLLLAVALVGCERRNEVTVTDTNTVVTSLPATDTTVVVQHDTVQEPTVYVDRVIPKPSDPQKNITVRIPTPGQRIVGPMFPVNGMSRTFENSVSYKLLGATGSVISSGHGMSHGPMGEFGPYDFQVSTNGYSGKATLEVFDNSPKDGKEIDKVTVPLIIGPDTLAVGAHDRMPVKVH